MIAGFDLRDRKMFGTLLGMQLRDRFLGSQLGRLWIVLSPCIMLGIFSFVFTVVFPQRIPGSTSPTAYLLWLVSGYGPWLAVAESLSTGAGAVIGSAGLIKNIAFKSELLPMVGALMGAVPLFVAFAYLLVLVILGGEAPNIWWLSLPLVAAIQYVLVAGIALHLAAITVFVRDTLMILPNILTMILFLSPVFFPITAFPEVARRISEFNPVYILADSYRRPIIEGQPPHLIHLAYLAVLAAIVFSLGLRFFRKLKPYFASRL